MNKDWHEVLPEYIRRMAVADCDYEHEIHRLIAEIGDTHAMSISNNIFGNNKVKVNTIYIDSMLVVAPNPYYTTGNDTPLFPGDVIVSIDGKTIDEIREKTIEYVSLSNEGGLARALGETALRSNNSSVDIGYMRYGNYNEVTCPASDYLSAHPFIKYRFINDSSCRMVNDSVGLIVAWKQYASAYKDVQDIIDKSSAIILDFRGYPKEAFTTVMNTSFWNLGTPHAIFSKPHPVLPGIYYKQPTSFNTPELDYFKGHIYILVNENSQSSMEYYTMITQSMPNVITVGSMTAGADGDVTRISLPGGINTMFSGLGVYYPDGSETQRVGVRIDYVVKPTVDGIVQGRDEQLEKALELISGR